jgi:hypothetical protein
LEYGDTVGINTTDKVDELPETDMAALQRQCSDFDYLIHYLETREMPEDEKQQRTCLRAEDQYVLRDNVLYHLHQPRVKGKIDLSQEFIFQLAVPQCKRKELLYHYHDSLVGGGHFGTSRTFAKLKQKYWWPRMFQMVKDYVDSCDVCQRSKVDRHQKPPPLHPLPVEDTFTRVHIDILGPLPKTKEGHQYVLLIIDSFSKWPEAFPLVTQEASEIASILYHEYITRYGAPHVIVSDRGKNFMSKLVSALCELFQIKRFYTSSYHPQTNSTVERTNSTLANTLRAYVDKNQENWSKILSSAMMAFRSTPATESTQYSPFHLLFGKEMTLPIDTDLIPKSTMPKQHKKFFEDLLDRLALGKTIAKDRMIEKNEKTKIRYDQNAKVPDFQFNDKVLKKSDVTKPGLSSKLSQKWEGPYIIEWIGPNHTYKLRDCQTNKLVKSLINASRLKHYQERLDSESSDENDDENDNQDTQANSGHTDNASDSHTQENKQNNENSMDTSIVKDTPIDAKQSTSHVNEDNKITLSQNQSQNDKISKVAPSKPIKILNTRICSRQRWFFIQWEQGPNSWITENLLDPNFVQEYWKTHTKTGRKRKRKASSFFRQKKD